MVTWHNDILDVDMREGEWLILTRTNYIANQVCNKLREEGYIFWREGEGWSVSLKCIVSDRGMDILTKRSISRTKIVKSIC